MIVRRALLPAFAFLVACSAHGGGVLPGQSERAALRQAAAIPTHAPCTMPVGLTNPLRGALSVRIAFGQLLTKSNGTRYAFPGVDFAYPAGKAVYAATAGAARYYANLSGFAKSIVVTGASGQATLYAHLSTSRLAKRSVHVRAGQEIAASGKPDLYFAYAPFGGVLNAANDANPCGGRSDASGTIGVLPSLLSVYARFNTLAIGGVVLPPSPGQADVPTPSTLNVENVVAPFADVATVYERSDTFSSFYVVLCGNVVFATGPARSAGPFVYTESQSAVAMVTPKLPPLVFFRDPGTQGSSLVAPLPLPDGQPCPAPAPALLYDFANPIFYAARQTAYVYYYRTDGQADSVSFVTSAPSVATITPTTITEYPSPPPSWPPPTNRASIEAVSPGAEAIYVTDKIDGPGTTINVTVEPTPTPAPVPTPLPNN